MKTSLQFKLALMFFVVMLVSASISISALLLIFSPIMEDNAEQQLRSVTSSMDELEKLNKYTADEIVNLCTNSSFSVNKIDSGDPALIQEIEEKGTVIESPGILPNVTAYTSVNGEIIEINSFAKENIYWVVNFIVIIAFIVCIVLGTVITAFISRTILQPIRDLNKATTEVARGNFSVRVRESMDAEYGKLTRNFNRMAEELSGIETLRGDFISSVSHEFKTPLASIQGFAKLLQDESISDSERREYTQIIIDETVRLSKLASNILNLSKLENQTTIGSKTRFSLDEQIRKIILMLEPEWSKKNISLDIALDDIYYYGNEDLMGQIWQNIINNAIKFTPEGGRIQFTIRQMSRGDKDAWLRFTVSDTGIGMSKVFQKHLFESFEQENPNISIKYGGTGLGLAICKNLVTLMGGSINVHSIEGVGSEFCVDVKLGLTEESYRRKNLDLLKFRDLKTLIVDDDIVTCEHASLIMSDLGVQAEYVTSGALAVLEIEKGIREMKPYDIVLVDLKMPDMDGIQTTKAIRRLVGAETLVVVMTAYEWKELEADARHAGVDFFITKPLFRSELVDLFEKINDFSEAVYEPEAAKGEVQFAGERILLVEDNELNLEVAASLLEMKGLTIESACNGLQALEKFCSTPVGYYDAVLMDIRMPVMDGLEAARNIRLFDKSDAQTIPIIAMTANAFDEDVEKSHAAGMNAHLAKPIDPEKLFAVLQEFI